MTGGIPGGPVGLCFHNHAATTINMKFGTHEIAGALDGIPPKELPFD